MKVAIKISIGWGLHLISTLSELWSQTLLVRNIFFAKLKKSPGKGELTVKLPSLIEEARDAVSCCCLPGTENLRRYPIGAFGLTPFGPRAIMGRLLKTTLSG